MPRLSALLTPWLEPSRDAARAVGSGHVRRAVARTVVDYNDLQACLAGQALVREATQDSLEQVGSVSVWNDHGDGHLSGAVTPIPKLYTIGVLT